MKTVQSTLLLLFLLLDLLHLYAYLFQKHSSYRRLSLNRLISSRSPNTLQAEDSDYGANSITVLQGLDPVRKRPGMYIGSTGTKGLHHLVFEIVDNSVDEALAGYCTEIYIMLHADGSVEVRDNGRGIPCAVHPVTGKSSLETVLCVLHAGGKFGGDASGYKVSGGLHGVGVSVVNALSERLVVEVVRDNKFHSMRFACGVPMTSLEERPATADDQRGTRIVFTPDKEIFRSTSEFEFDRIAARLDELAYLNPGLTVTLKDHRRSAAPSSSSEPSPKQEEDDSLSSLSIGRKRVFRHDGGIGELIQVMCKGKENLYPEIDVISMKDHRKNITVEIAMRWSLDQYDDVIFGFANGIRTSDGGSHIDGLKSAISRTMNQLMKKSGKTKEASIPGEFIREGLTAVVSVKVPEPEFEGQTKTRLGNPEVRQIVDGVVSDALQTLLEWNPALLTAIAAKAIRAQNAALAAKAARDMVRRKSVLQSAVLPGKLADCSNREASESELYIVEGDSAAGSAKLGRDRRFQAILPLKGKILNIEKASSEKIYQNAELQALISAIGLGTRGSSLETENLRYHRIIIMTDADVDGSHIRLLLLTFFYRYQKELIERGMIFVACPPLYKVTYRVGGSSKSKEKVEYFYDDDSYNSFLANQRLSDASRSFQVQRFKGLGEMMPVQLWETTMNPANRRLKIVSVEDAAAADRMFRVLMGDSLQERKEFILNNANQLKVVDLDY